MNAVNSQNISEDQPLLTEQRTVSIWEILVKLKTVAGLTAFIIYMLFLCFSVISGQRKGNKVDRGREHRSSCPN